MKIGELLLIKDLLVTAKVRGQDVTGFYVPIVFGGCSGVEAHEKRCLYTGYPDDNPFGDSDGEYYCVDDPSTVRKATNVEAAMFVVDLIERMTKE